MTGPDRHHGLEPKAVPDLMAEPKHYHVIIGLEEKAGEMIGEFVLAMNHRIALGRIANAIHPYPTQAEAIRRVGDLYNKTRLTPRVSRFFKGWLTWRRGK